MLVSLIFSFSEHKAMRLWENVALVGTVIVSVGGGIEAVSVGAFTEQQV